MWLLPLLQLFIIVNNEPIVNVSDETTGRFATTCKFFRDAIYGYEIISICGSFRFPDQHNNKFPFVVLNASLNFSGFLSISKLGGTTLATTSRGQLNFHSLTFVDL